MRTMEIIASVSNVLPSMRMDEMQYLTWEQIDYATRLDALNKIYDTRDMIYANATAATAKDLYGILARMDGDAKAKRYARPLTQDEQAEQLLDILNAGAAPRNATDADLRNMGIDV